LSTKSMLILKCFTNASQFHYNQRVSKVQCKIMSVAKANTHCSNLYTLVDFAVFGADKEVKSLLLVQP